jgi:tRNA U55 pseudouridine synthase TruB
MCHISYSVEQVAAAKGKRLHEMARRGRTFAPVRRREIRKGTSQHIRTVLSLDIAGMKV